MFRCLFGDAILCTALGDRIHVPQRTQVNADDAAEALIDVAGISTSCALVTSLSRKRSHQDSGAIQMTDGFV